MNEEVCALCGVDKALRVDRVAADDDAAALVIEAVADGRGGGRVVDLKGRDYQSPILQDDLRSLASFEL